MVSYYNSASMMYRQQTVTTPNTQFPNHSNTMQHHSWYTSGYHQNPQMSMAAAAAAAAASYCLQDEQQMWHPHTHPTMFHNDFNDFINNHQSTPPPPNLNNLNCNNLGGHHLIDGDNNQLPSPSITVSGSEMSSPGGLRNGNVSPQQQQQLHQQQCLTTPTTATTTLTTNRPPPARSPYEWIKKTSYQTQPNPGKTRTKDKYRVVYTDHQRVELEKEFYYSRYITIRRKAELANNLGLSERQVKIWFQNRRAKERKQVKKRDELSHHQHKDNIINNMTQQMILNQQQYQQQQQQQDNRMLHVANDTDLIGQNNLTRLV